MTTTRIGAVLGLLIALNASPAVAGKAFTVSQYGIVSATLPWAVALEKGYFKQNELDVDNVISANGGGTAVRNMLAGDFPFAELSTAATIAGLRQGMKLKIIYAAVHNMGETSWMVLPDSPVKTLADLKGRKAGYNNPRSATEQVLRTVLARNGLSNDVTLVSTGGQAAGLTILRQKGIDATVASDPAITIAGDKLRLLFRVSDYLKDLVWSIGVTTEEFAKANPQMLRSLIKTRRQGVQFILKEPEEAAKIYAKVWQFDGDLARRIVPQFAKFNYYSQGDISKAGLDTVVEGMQLTGELRGPIDLGSAIDKSFLPEDLRN
jgi:NitT/TauT family transport system substrate-binding protein